MTGDSIEHGDRFEKPSTEQMVENTNLVNWKKSLPPGWSSLTGELPSESELARIWNIHNYKVNKPKCPVCKEEDWQFEWESNYDGVDAMTMHSYQVVLLDHECPLCGYQLSDDEIEKIEEYEVEHGEPPVYDPY